jgi:E3 ubiquitin-protein ligase FANCL
VTALHCDTHLAQLIAPYSSVVTKRMQQSQNVHDFVVELQEIAARALQLPNQGVNSTQTNSIVVQHTHPTEYYAHILKEIEEIGWSMIQDIDESMTTIKLLLTDECKRTHTVTIKLSATYPTTAPACTADLPSELDLEWSRRHRLRDVMRQYADFIQTFQAFWEVLDDFDQHVCVLELSKPSMSSTTRRLALERHCSVQVRIDPMRPRALCECKFMGSETAVAPLKQQLNEGLFSWDTERMPRENLERILKIQFPQRSEHKVESFDMECAICYAYELDNTVPDFVCDNAKCARSFHRTCLLDWLKALPNTRQSFNTVFGLCPYCSAALTVTLPHR